MNKANYVIFLTEGLKDKIKARREKATREAEIEAEKYKKMTTAERRKELAKVGIVGAGALGTHAALKDAHQKAKDSGIYDAARRKLGMS